MADRPQPVYDGDGPYVFVSYSHEDEAVVFKEIRWLQDHGVDVWYDEGISPGSEWSDALAQAMKGCSHFIYFITPQSVESENCRRELNFALEEDCQVLAVHLEEMDLPDGLRLNLSNRQAIHRYRLDEDEYQQKLSQLLSRIIEPRAGSEIALKSRQSAHPRFWTSLGLALLLISGLVVLAAGDYVSLWWAYNTPAWLESRVPQEIKFAETTDGVRIAYATSGTGTPLVLVVGWQTHLQLGLLFDAPDIVNALSSRHLLVRYDGRGFGMSDRDIEEISLATRVRDLEAVVAAVGAENVAILGTSKGGEAAIPYTAAHPEKVSSLIIAGGSLGIAWTGLSPSERGDFDNFLGLLRSSWDVQAVRAVLAGPSTQLSEQELTDSMLISGSGPAHAEFLESSMLADVSTEAGQIRQPTLLIAGQHDQVAPVEYMRQIAAQIPHAKTKILDTSHNDTIRGRRTIGLVLEFLREEGLED